jgi:hypothetical protein
MKEDELIDKLGAENAKDIYLSYHDKNTVEIKNDLLDWMGAEITDAQAEELATAIVKYLKELE